MNMVFWMMSPLGSRRQSEGKKGLRRLYNIFPASVSSGGFIDVYYIVKNKNN